MIIRVMVVARDVSQVLPNKFPDSGTLGDRDGEANGRWRRGHTGPGSWSGCLGVGVGEFGAAGPARHSRSGQRIDKRIVNGGKEEN